MASVPKHTSFEFGDQMIQWEDEARAIISDVKNHVRQIFISEQLPSSNREIFLNCETLEENKYTIRVSSSGFQTVGNDFDNIEQLTDGVTYETAYALLGAISPNYINSFGNDLAKALEKIA